MNTEREIDRRIRMARFRPDYRSRSDTWFAWHPVRTGALGSGRFVWLKKVHRERILGITIYQEL